MDKPSEPVRPGVPIPAISLWQPWATLIACGAKQIETRSWPAPPRLIGREVAIHAAKRFGPEERALCGEEPFRSALVAAGITSLQQFPLGAVVAVVRVLECRPTYTGPDAQHQQIAYGIDDYWLDDLTEQEWAFGDFSPSRFGWRMDIVERFDPAIPAAGAQGIWMWSRPGVDWPESLP